MSLRSFGRFGPSCFLRYYKAHMSNVSGKLSEIQNELRAAGVDGWLLYDFKRSNDLACAFLEIPHDSILTRRMYYWIPADGSPVKLLNAIESHTLDHQSGELSLYQTWQDLDAGLTKLLAGKKRVAMEYSPRGAIPAVSKVDGGTIDLVREKGVEVVSSANLLQLFTGIWNKGKLESHLFAARVLDEVVEKAWNKIEASLKKGELVTEYDIQQYILRLFKENDCVASDAPICAVNANSANPHYQPSKKHSFPIKKGDFILIDLWCKQNKPHAVYADITRVGVAGTPSPKQKEVFEIVREAQQAALDLVQKSFADKKPLQGYQVDQASRNVIEKSGYGKYFIHRTGHNIDENDHGNGTHIDNFETHDTRLIIPGTCFSIEPGIYLPGEFGVRLEYDVFIHWDSKVQVTGGQQKEIRCLEVCSE